MYDQPRHSGTGGGITPHLLFILRFNSAQTPNSYPGFESSFTDIIFRLLRSKPSSVIQNIILLGQKIQFRETKDQIFTFTINY